MSQSVLKLLLASPMALAISGVVAGAALAAPEATAPQTQVSQASALNLAGANQLLANQTAMPTQREMQSQITQPMAQPGVVQPQQNPAQAGMPQSLEPIAFPTVGQMSQPLPAPVLLDPAMSQPQVTSITQLTDVKPTDWAYQALQSLVERYGCIAGYPDSTFRGQRAATRFELAAALNACLDVISDRFATKEDLAAVRKLQQEFAKELAALKGRVTNLEARTSKLEAQQFSTTTKLRGVAVVSFSDALSGTNASQNGFVRTNGDNSIVTYRVRLNLDTSFSGKDLLRTRLQAGNTPSFASTATSGLGLYNTSRLAYDVPGNPNIGGTSQAGESTANQFTLDKLFYRFPVFGKGTLQVDALRAELNDNMQNFNPFLESGDRGALSRFFRFNPIYRVGGDAGVTFSYPLVQADKRDLLRFSVAYYGGSTQVPGSACNGIADSACYAPSNPVGLFRGGSGLFGGAYSASIQVESNPITPLRVGLLYSRSYGLDVSGSTGSVLASNPIQGLTTGAATNQFRNMGADNVGFQFTYRVIPKLAISGWVGYSKAFDPSPAVRSADLVNWAISFAAPDLWRKGDLAALSFGQAPQVINGVRNGANLTNVNDTSATYLLEGQYRFQINNFISVTPGIIAVFNPNGGSNTGNGITAPNNDTTIIGVIRTTFTF